MLNCGKYKLVLTSTKPCVRRTIQVNMYPMCSMDTGSKRFSKWVTRIQPPNNLKSTSDNIICTNNKQIHWFVPAVYSKTNKSYETYQTTYQSTKQHATNCEEQLRSNNKLQTNK